MQFIRKALWPTAIVAAFLMLFGALGSAINAETLSDVTSASGDVVIGGEDTAIWVEVTPDAAPPAPVDPLADEKAAVSDAVDTLIDADTTLAAIEGAEALETALRGIYPDELANEAGGTDGDPDTAGDNPADLTANTFDLNGDGDSADTEPLYGDASSAVAGEDGGSIAVLRALVIARNLAVEALDTAIGSGVLGDIETARDALATAQTAVQNAGNRITGLGLLAPVVPETVTPPEAVTYTVSVDGDAKIVGALVDDAIVKQVDGRSTVRHLEAGSYDGMASVVLVMVDCDSGEFKVTFESDASSGLSESETFDCAGDVEGAEIKPAKSAIYLDSDTTSTLITVTIEDEGGSPAATADDEVDFSTDSCEFEEASSRTPTVYSADSTTDGRGNTVATVTLDCSDAGPGVATITAVIDKPGRDVDLVTTVTVVGPPASLTVEAATMMDTLACGSVATLTINVVDSADQPVANGTVVNLTTNVEGVLVAPARTSGGVATAYLITSNVAVGSYAVVVQSGSAVGYVTVTCGVEMEMDADADAPSITPPNTGDAGLAETSGSSWMLLAIAGALASVMVAVGKGMPLFFRRS